MIELLEISWSGTCLAGLWKSRLAEQLFWIREVWTELAPQDYDTRARIRAVDELDPGNGGKGLRNRELEKRGSAEESYMEAVRLIRGA